MSIASLLFCNFHQADLLHYKLLYYLYSALNIATILSCIPYYLLNYIKVVSFTLLLCLHYLYIFTC